jgi:predicted amidohydrolase YtcJ
MKTLFLTALLLTGAATAHAAAAPADILFVNGKVLTVDSKFSIASSVAVSDGRIAAVGGPELVKRYSAKQVIDLRGRVLMPGFIDTHVHVIPKPRRSVDLSQAKSIADVQALVRAKAQELGPAEWVTGYGWDEAALAEKRNLSSRDLDAVSPANPVLLTRAGQHSAVANSMALKLAGIDRSTPDPDRGLIEHDAAGELNGIIRERHDIVSRLVPLPTADELAPSVTGSIRALLPLGITSFMEALTTIDDEPVAGGGLGQPSRVATYALYRRIYGGQGAELPRATLYIVYPGAERLKRFPYHTGHGDDRLKLGPIGEAPAVDGGFTGPTAWTLQDYKGLPGFRGKPSLTPEELRELVATSHALGWQIGTHAIGDAAIQELVDVYSAELDRKPTRDHRWFTSHFTMLPPQATMTLMRKHDIWAAVQPNFLYNLEARYVQTLDGARLQHINPVATPLRNGVKVVMGSDNLPIGPFVGVYTAVSRRGQSGTVYGADEAISREEAIRLYTRQAAYLSWDEAKKGSIEPGKFADMIIVDRDILKVPERELLQAQVDQTYVGGRLVYDRAGPATR